LRRAGSEQMAALGEGGNGALPAGGSARTNDTAKERG